MINKRFKFLVIGIVIIVAFFSLKIINDYRERNLADLIKYKPNDFYSFGFIHEFINVPEDYAYEWFTKDREPVDELMEFLGQYDVKKINEKEFNDNRNNKIEFMFYIYHSKARPAIVMGHENHIQIIVGKYYSIINDPIDIEWIEKYNEKHKKMYGD